MDIRIWYNNWYKIAFKMAINMHFEVKQVGRNGQI